MTREEILKKQLDAEQIETARELAEMLRLVQEMGRRLCNESHGDIYDDARALMSLLHQARGQAEFIDSKLSSADPVADLLRKQSHAG